MRGFGIFGIVKETGVDDEGLIEFGRKYFGNFPIYCDKSRSFYAAMGNRNAVLELPSLITLVRHAYGAFRRVGEKEIEWNTKGEGLVKGGIILFDPKGRARYAYEEETGKELPVADLVVAMEAMRREQSTKPQSASLN